MKRIPASLFKSVLHVVRPQSLQQPQGFQLPTPWSQVTGTRSGRAAQAASGRQIPKIIWTYWNQVEPDAFVKECIQSWRLQCPDYEVRLVHPGNLDHYVTTGALPGEFAQLHPTKQSDWLRLYLVAHHGGFWLDASTLLTQSLAWMAPAPDQTVEFTGFYLEKFTRDAHFPVIESWAFGAVAGSAFVMAWHREFHQALVVEGTQAYLQRLQSQPNWVDVLQGIRDPHYLLIHIAAQQVLRQQGTAHLALFKAEDTAYYYHHALRWKWYLLYPQLCLTASERPAAPIVKLRGGERRHFTQMLAQHGGAVPRSVWHRALHPDAKHTIQQA